MANILIQCDEPRFNKLQCSNGSNKLGQGCNLDYATLVVEIVFSGESLRIIQISLVVIDHISRIILNASLVVVK